MNRVLPPKQPPKTGAELIAAERERQMSQEGFDANHDDDFYHAVGQMSTAAACYIFDYYAKQYPAQIDSEQCYRIAGDFWPWDAHWFKPTVSDPIRQLTKAGALIAAEIDRLQRLASLKE